MAYARIAARHFGTEHHEYYVTPDDLVRSIGEVAASYDQPFGNSSALPAYYCAKVERGRTASAGCSPATAETSCSAATRATPSSACLAGIARCRPTCVQRVLEPVFGRSALGRAPLLRKGRELHRAGQGADARSACRCTTCCAGWAPRACSRRDFLARIDQDGPLRQQREVWAQARSDRTRSTARSLSTGATRWPRAICPRCAAPPNWPASTSASRCWTRLARLLDAAAGRLQAQGAEAALVLQGGASRLPARRDHLPRGSTASACRSASGRSRHAGLRALAVDSLHGMAARGIVRPEFIRELIEHYLRRAPRLLRRIGLDPDDAGAVDAPTCAGVQGEGLTLPLHAVHDGAVRPALLAGGPGGILRLRSPFAHGGRRVVVLGVLVLLRLVDAGLHLAVAGFDRHQFLSRTAHRTQCARYMSNPVRSARSMLRAPGLGNRSRLPMLASGLFKYATELARESELLSAVLDPALTTAIAAPSANTALASTGCV